MSAKWKKRKFTKRNIEDLLGTLPKGLKAGFETKGEYQDKTVCIIWVPPDSHPLHEELETWCNKNKIVEILNT